MFTSLIKAISKGFINLITFKKPLRTLAVTVLVVLAVYFYITHSSKTTTTTDAVSETVVNMATAGDINSDSSFSSVGMVQSISEVQLKMGAGGQVTSVSTAIGKNVAAGTVLAQVDNAPQSASLLQAQGAYDAAVAGVSQSDSGTRDAETRLQSAKDLLKTTVKNAYTAENTILITSVDTFFSNPESGIIGLQITGDSNTLNKLRTNFRGVMPRFQESINSITSDNLIESANTAKEYTSMLLAIVDGLTSATTNTNNPSTFNGAKLSTYTPGLLANRTALTAIVSGIDNAVAGIETAQETLKRAQVSGTGNDLSISAAQIKIALGTLRSAQANFEKTLVRTPISGVVNALYIKKGDYVSMGQDAAVVANNNGLEVSTYINLEDRDLVTIGDSVSIEGSATGTITAIAGAVDPKNGKVAVKINIENNSGLTNGTSVKIIFKKKVDTVTNIKQIIVPIASVKLSSEGPLLFTIDAENKLVAKPVTLGDVIGDNVIITSGVDNNTNIVLDVRGLKAGTKVTVATK